MVTWVIPAASSGKDLLMLFTLSQLVNWKVEKLLSLFFFISTDFGGLDYWLIIESVF
jgi:hypothetical protein